MTISLVCKKDDGYSFLCGTYPTANYNALDINDTKYHVTRLIRAMNGSGKQVEGLMFIRNRANKIYGKVVTGIANSSLVFVYAELGVDAAVELKLKYDVKL